MATQKELENNIKKMQLLLKNAQSELQKQTFRDILTDLKKQLALLKAKNSHVENPEKSLRDKSNSQPKEEVKKLLKVVKYSEVIETTTSPQLKIDKPPKTESKSTPQPSPTPTDLTEINKPPKTESKSTPQPSPTPTDLTEIESSSNQEIDTQKPSTKEPTETPPPEPTLSNETHIKSSPSQDKDSTSTEQPHPQNQSIQSKIFQGIGVIQGEIIKDSSEQFYNLIYQGKLYKLLIKKLKVRETIDKNYPFNSPKILVVYPYTKYNPELESGHEIAFTLVRIKDEWSPEAKTNLGLDINEFRLCGFWQKRHGDFSVISVQRNRLKKGLKKLLKNTASSKKIKIVTHVPLLWSNPPVEAVFRGEEGRYFVEVKASFMPEKEQWEFLELLSEPSLKHPQFVRFPKKKTVSTEAVDVEQS
ncbi:MAG: hypothetical protein QNJ68_13895 [Microcoleaceae cyanobacterium MO_207.B10]|nr:hypothetical protein [Microcoleaceae cyanobacterium MO_207.B10]